MSFICMKMKNDFHVKGQAPTLVLKQRPRGNSEMAHFLCLMYHFSVCIAYKMKHSFLWLTYYFSVFGYQMKHYFSCLINQFSFSEHQIKIPFLNLVCYFLRIGVSILIGWNTPRVSKMTWNNTSRPLKQWDSPHKTTLKSFDLRFIWLDVDLVKRSRVNWIHVNNLINEK